MKGISWNKQSAARDPRQTQSEYKTIIQNRLKNLQPAHLVVDEHWTFSKKPASIIFVRQTPTLVHSKAQLLALLPMQVQNHLVDIHIHMRPFAAQLVFVDTYHASLFMAGFSSQGFDLSYDTNGEFYSQHISTSQISLDSSSNSILKRDDTPESNHSLQRASASSNITSSNPSSAREHCSVSRNSYSTTFQRERCNCTANQHRQEFVKLKCSSRIPCILFDDGDMQRLTSCAMHFLKDLFADFALYNVQFDFQRNCWHVHLDQEFQVQRSLRRINLSVKYSVEQCKQSLPVFPQATIAPLGSIDHSILHAKTIDQSLISSMSLPKESLVIRKRKPEPSPFTAPNQSISKQSDLTNVKPLGQSISKQSDPSISKSSYSSRITSTDVSGLKGEVDHSITSNTIVPKKKSPVKERNSSIPSSPLKSKKQPVKESVDLVQFDTCKSVRLLGISFGLSDQQKKAFVVLQSKSHISSPSSTQNSQSSSTEAGKRRKRLGPTTLDLQALALGPSQTALTARSRRLVLGRSSIHSWGLFADEDIEANALVMEYVGEIVRASIANAREKRYEQFEAALGRMASSYLFRLDQERVVDATFVGNLARFINHSCDPVCVARIVQGNGSDLSIVMYAKRDIRKGEEITYDYKFPIESDPSRRVPCLCSSRLCRQFLN